MKFTIFTAILALSFNALAVQPDLLEDYSVCYKEMNKIALDHVKESPDTIMRVSETGYSFDRLYSDISFFNMDIEDRKAIYLDYLQNEEQTQFYTVRINPKRGMPFNRLFALDNQSCKLKYHYKPSGSLGGISFGEATPI